MSSHTERDLDRAAHPAPCTTDQNGQRQISPQPDPAAVVRNFGGPSTPLPPEPYRPGK